MNKRITVHRIAGRFHGNRFPARNIGYNYIHEENCGFDIERVRGMERGASDDL